MIYCRESEKNRGLQGVWNRWSVCGQCFSVSGNRRGARGQRLAKVAAQVNCLECMTVVETPTVSE